MISKHYRFGSNSLDVGDRTYTDKYLKQYKQSTFISIKDNKFL